MLTSLVLTSLVYCMSFSRRVEASPQNSRSFIQAVKAVSDSLHSAVVAMPLICLGTSFIGGVLIGPEFRTAFTRFDNADDIPARLFKGGKTLRCTVVRVTDGDTLRVSHCPRFGPLLGLSHVRIPRAQGGSARLTDSTIAVRVCAVDAPETAKFGSPGQPFGDQATAFVEDRLLFRAPAAESNSHNGEGRGRRGLVVVNNKGLVVGRRVWVKLLSRDRYQRAVASVTYRRPGLLGALPFSKWSKLDVSEELVKNGLATVYTQVNSNQVLASSAVSFFGSVEAIH